MPLVRKATCDFEGCKAECLEKTFGEGFPEWAAFKGLQLNRGDVYICPKHKIEIAKFMRPGEPFE